MYKETIRVVDRRLCWRRVGSGPPLLLVNGYAATGADWDPGFLAALAEGHEVLCPDNRGMGESDLGSEPLTVDVIASDLRAVLEAAAVKVQVLSLPPAFAAPVTSNGKAATRRHQPCTSLLGPQHAPASLDSLTNSQEIFDAGTFLGA